MELKDFEIKLAEMKTALEEKAKNDVRIAVDAEVKALKDAAALIKGLPEGVTPDQITELMVKAQKAIDEGAETVKAFDQLQIKLKATPLGAPQTKSLESVIADAITEKTDDIAKMARGEKGFKSVSMDLKTVGDITTSNVTGGTVWGAQYRPGIIEAAKRKLHMREVIPGGTVGQGTDYYFMKQADLGEGNPAFVAEGAAKPQMDEDLVESSVKIETLAGYERITRKAMLNIPGMVSFLQSRMVERLLRVEDSNILYGDGVSPNLKGILTAGNFTASTSTATTLIERIIDDLAALEDTNERNATAIGLRPIDYFGFFKNKASGSGEYDLPRNVTWVNGVMYISGIPVFATTAFTDGDYMVGDFSQGVQFLTQEGMRLEFFEQDADNVTKNKITVRIEEVVTLPVFGADYFIKGTRP